MDRRSFLASSAVALGGLAAFGPAFGAARSAVPARLGVQLYTVRDIFPNDFIGVLEAIKRMGYDEVEFAGYHDRDPRAVRAVLDDIGLTAPATHVGIDVLRNDFDATIETANIVGHDYVILPWLADEARPTSLDGYRRLAEELNGWGERAQAAGVQMAYHNHDFEFTVFEDGMGYATMLDETDPDLVDFELDLFWITQAGYDPVDFFESHPGRFPLFHVKDRTAEGAMTSVGAGAIDFVKIFDHAEQAGLKHAIIEHDNPGEQRNASLDTLAESYAYLESLR